MVHNEKSNRRKLEMSGLMKRAAMALVPVAAVAIGALATPAAAHDRRERLALWPDDQG
jgi:hypothetical protein